MALLAFVNEPPHCDMDVEEAVCAHVLARADGIADVEAHVKPDDFACVIYGRLFEAVQFLRAENMTVSVLVLKARMSGEVLKEIEERTRMEAIDFLQKLSWQATPNTRIGELAKIIADRAMRRRMDAELEAGRSRLSNYDVPVSDCISDVVAAAGEVVESEAKGAGYLRLPDAVDAMMQQAEDALNGVRVPAIRSGLKQLDYITGGFQAGNMVVVAGRPGQGKTVLLSTIARAAAQEGKPVLFFEMEMTRNEIMHRMCADLDYDTFQRGPEKPLAYSRMRKGIFRGGEFERMHQASLLLRMLPIDIFDTPGMTIHEIGAHAQRFVDKARTMGVVIIDYLQIIKATDRYKGSKYGEMTEVSNETKRLAKRLGWPVVVGCQLSRAVESRSEKDKRPQLSDLRETGAIEQDADVVIGMHRPLYYVNQKRPLKGKEDEVGWMNWLEDRERVKHQLDLPLLKNRGGPDGYVKAFVDIGASAIRNDGIVATAEAEDDPGQDLLI
jgi:replicative DNA helicase